MNRMKLIALTAAATMFTQGTTTAQQNNIPSASQLTMCPNLSGHDRDLFSPLATDDYQRLQGGEASAISIPSSNGFSLVTFDRTNTLDEICSKMASSKALRDSLQTEWDADHPKHPRIRHAIYEIAKKLPWNWACFHKSPEYN